MPFQQEQRAYRQAQASTYDRMDATVPFNPETFVSYRPKALVSVDGPLDSKEIKERIFWVNKMRVCRNISPRPKQFAALFTQHCFPLKDGTGGKTRQAEVRMRVATSDGEIRSLWYEVSGSPNLSDGPASDPELITNLEQVHGCNSLCSIFVLQVNAMIELRLIADCGD